MGVEALKAEITALEQRRSDDFTDPRVAQIAKELQLLATNREIEVLSARKNEDVFLAGVESLRAEMTRLSNLSTDMSTLKLVTIDQQALEPVAPSKPNRLLIMALGLFGGAVLAFFIALTRIMVVTGSAPRVDEDITSSSRVRGDVKSTSSAKPNLSQIS